MSYPGKRETNDNNESQFVPVAYATMTSSDDQQEAQPDGSGHSAIPPESVQVVSIIDESDVQQSSLHQHQPLQQGHRPISPDPGTVMDPTMIQVVTFDEQPSEIEGETSERLIHNLQESDNMRQESTPLLHQNAPVNINTLTSNDSYANDDEMFEGRAECHDMIWAVLFYSHIAVVVFAGLRLAPRGYALMENDDLDLEKLHDFMEQNFVNDEDFTAKDLDMLTHFLHQFQAWWSVYPFRIAWFTWMMCVIAFFSKLLKNIIQSRTVFFVSSSLIVFGIAIGLLVMILFLDKGFFGFLVSVVLVGTVGVYIRKRLWPKVEFAALNLEIALAGIGNNLGTYLWVLGCAMLTLAWVTFWCYTVLGLMSYVTATKCPDLKWDSNNNQDNDTCGATNAVLLALLLSLYWTLSHVRATIQVYVAGVMGTWCFDKDAAQGFCSSAVTSSMYRSLTFSSGPIAFGSLLQGAAKVLRSILSHSKMHQNRTNQMVHDAGDDCRCCCFGLGGLILECLSEVFGDVLDYFSQWAYVFVGINGTSYLDSGKAVMNLFKTRGWTALITDRVVALTLGVAMFYGGILTGLAAIVLERLVTWIASVGDHADDVPPSYIFGPLKNIPFVSFTLGFVVGCVVSAVMMNVIQGAVNTLIVCWAESPESFSNNHKYWADQMTAVWSSAFPGSQTPNGHRDTTLSADTGNSGRYGATETAVP